MIISTNELIVLVASLIGSAFFSGSEAVLMSIGLDRTKQLIEKGGKEAKAMLFMAEKSTELLSTILVGNNIANILAASLTTTLATRYFKSDAVGISVGVTTILILIFGEIIPKTFARGHAEKLSVSIIRILQFMYYLISPVVIPLVWLIHRVLGENAQLRGNVVTRSDLEYMVNKAEKDRTIDSKHIELLTSILEFPSIRVKDIMIPRTNVKYIKKSMAFSDILDYAKLDAFTRYPVCDGDLDHAIGFLHIKDLAFIRNGEIEKFKTENYVKPYFFVYEHMKINAVFDHMNRKKTHMALVKDETGMVVGLVTLEDIVEEIMGDILDEHDDEETNDPLNGTVDDVLIVDANISLRDLYNDYDIKIPLNENYSTLAGFILNQLGNSFPKKGQIIVSDGYSLELFKVDQYEVRQVKIRNNSGDSHLYSRNDSDFKSTDTESIKTILDKTDLKH